MTSKTNSKKFKIGDYVFAKLTNHLVWPAKVIKHINSVTYEVMFFGYAETAEMKSGNLFAFLQHKQRFVNSKTMKCVKFHRAVAALEQAYQEDNHWATDQSKNVLSFLKFFVILFFVFTAAELIFVLLLPEGIELAINVNSNDLQTQQNAKLLELKLLTGIIKPEQAQQQILLYPNWLTAKRQFNKLAIDAKKRRFQNKQLLEIKLKIQNALDKSHFALDSIVCEAQILYSFEYTTYLLLRNHYLVDYVHQLQDYAASSIEGHNAIIRNVFRSVFNVMMKTFVNFDVNESFWQQFHALVREHKENTDWISGNRCEYLSEEQYKAVVTNKEQLQEARHSNEVEQTF